MDGHRVEIHPYAFSGLDYVSQHIHIWSCHIGDVTENAFANMTRIAELDFNINTITSWSRFAFGGREDDTLSHVCTLFLASNIVGCNCELFEFYDRLRRDSCVGVNFILCNPDPSQP